MRRSILATSLLAGLLALPVALAAAGVLRRPDAGLARPGHALYAAAAILAIALPVWRLVLLKQKKPLPDICTRQGLVIVYIGISGLLALAVTAPAFPESALAAWLAGAGAVTLFSLIPLGLLAYMRRKLPPEPGPDSPNPPSKTDRR